MNNKRTTNHIKVIIITITIIIDIIIVQIKVKVKKKEGVGAEVKAIKTKIFHYNHMMNYYCFFLLLDYI